MPAAEREEEERKRNKESERERVRGGHCRREREREIERERSLLTSTPYEVSETDARDTPEINSKGDMLARSQSAVKRIWHIQDSQGQILALAFRFKPITRLSCPLFARKW